ncbi:MAG TPA: SGNH/GDSL hydrolase family protein [Planctomycetota bacterium]|nr:SGNH/GDSL hydrolase family protein [Planctomycetota bacterium]
MRLIQMTFPTWASCILALVSVSAEDAPLPVEVAPNDAKIHYQGRFDTQDAKGPRCAWPACDVSVKFKGTAVNAKLGEAGNDRIDVIVDGKEAKVLTPKGASVVYALAPDLPDGEHTVELMKRTEANQGVTQFQGFQLSAGAQLLDQPAHKHRLEVIGDSISCGYGNEGKNQNEHYKAETENAFLTYGAMAARALNADYVCVAWSGRKMWPDYSIPEVYGRTLPNDAKSEWDFSKQIPDVVLINLGTNDFRGKNPDEKGWTEAYKNFIARVRKNYPKAAIYCASGSMMSDSWPPDQHALSTLHKYLNEIIDELKKAGDSNIRFIAFDPQDQKNGLGSDWHPSVKTHELMAAKLVEAIKKDLGW